MIDRAQIEDLRGGKNLLGFSAGVDSTALFFLLLEGGIDFDIAIVDYGLREQSKLEVAYAKRLAATHQKQIYLHTAPRITSNFESRARVVRYGFFESLIAQHGYENLLLAHQLNDRLEWFLMQFFRGSGLGSILGFDRVEEREGYRIVRPLWECAREEIASYLGEREYFEDSSNAEEKYLRNVVRKSYADSMISAHGEGIARSLRYLREEKQELYAPLGASRLGHVFYFPRSGGLQNLFYIDGVLKKLGYVWSRQQRDEVCAQGFSACIAGGGLGGEIIIDCSERFIFVARVEFESIVMPKSFKNLARELGLPRRIRKEFYGLLQGGRISTEDLSIFKS